MRILPAAGFAVQPWKNGGGVTTEIIVSPPGAGFDTFDWRISMARVASDGPFSLFPGIDRSLAVLEGEAIRLMVEGRGEIIVNRESHPAVFPGEIAITGTLTSGPILDLNVMTRRSKWRHLLSRVAVEAGPFALARCGDVSLAIIRGSAGACAGQRFADGDAILLDDSGTLDLRLDRHGVIWVADLWRR